MSGGARGPHCRGGLLMTLGGVPRAAFWRCWARAEAPRIVAPAPATAARRDRWVKPFGMMFLLVDATLEWSPVGAVSSSLQSRASNLICVIEWRSSLMPIPQTMRYMNAEGAGAPDVLKLSTGPVP